MSEHGRPLTERGRPMTERLRPASVVDAELEAQASRAADLGQDESAQAFGMVTQPLAPMAAAPCQTERAAQVLTPGALAFLAQLHARFEGRRQALLSARRQRQLAFEAGASPHFLDETRAIRSEGWRVKPAPPALERRVVEITGPVEAKMMVNALNCGADCFMADFEDALSPTWDNVVAGQRNLMDWSRGRLVHTSPEGKRYEVAEGSRTTLLVRPRGWHLDESHVEATGSPAGLPGHPAPRVSASLVDAGLFLFHNAVRLQATGKGPFLYLPKMEHHLEARLWDDVLAFAEEWLGLGRGTVRVTCLIETLPAAFQMHEILWQLRDRACGLNAGRWDYLFSTLKTLHTSLASQGKTLPDRTDLGMGQPFLRAYAGLLVATCHARGAHAMGGMSAFIPDRRDAAVTASALQAVRDDKRREAGAGFDGTWVAHPDLVAVARGEFEAVLQGRPNQLDAGALPAFPAQAAPAQASGAGADAAADRLAVEDATAAALLAVPVGKPTLAGVRHNVRACIVYFAHWLRGTGAVAIDHLMEDAATAEISRTQLWHWRHACSGKGAPLAEGGTVDDALLDRVFREEEARAAAEPGLSSASIQVAAASKLVHRLVTADAMEPFATTWAYRELGA